MDYSRQSETFCSLALCVSACRAVAYPRRRVPSVVKIYKILGSSNILVGKRSQTFRRRHYAYWLLDAYPCLMLLRAFTGSPEQEAGAAP